jgi:hypothetical protein
MCFCLSKRDSICRETYKNPENLAYFKRVRVVWWGMTQRHTAALPLHGGAAPAWLFNRMVEMAGAITTLIVQDAGPRELLRRLSDPFWFQAFGCVIGFDWHSSGVTTTVCGALKEAARKYGGDMGIVVCGGKGKTSRKTPDDILRACDTYGTDAKPLIHASKLAAKVDNTGVQDGYQLYHHSFFFLPQDQSWCVVQQGMNENERYARRYHWLSETLPNFICDPHAAIACDSRGDTLNLVAGEGDSHRQALVMASREHPDRLLKEIQPLIEAESHLPLFDGLYPSNRKGHVDLYMPDRHSITTRDIHPSALKKVLIKTYERQAGDFEQLLAEPGIGPQAMRSLSLVAEIIYNAPASKRDPAAYSFAHGGKDGHPYEVNRPLYDQNIERLRETINSAKLGVFDKAKALRSLSAFTEQLA